MKNLFFLLTCLCTLSVVAQVTPPPPPPAPPVAPTAPTPPMPPQKTIIIEEKVTRKMQDGKVIQEDISREIKGDTTRIKIGGVEIIIKDENGKKTKKIIKEDGKEIEIEEEIGAEEDGGVDIDMEDRKKDEKKTVKKLSNIKTRWGMVDLGVNTLMQDGSFSLQGDANALSLNYGKSLNWNLHLFKQRINLIDHKINFIYGMSFDFNNYNFSEPITLQRNTSPLAITFNDTIEYKKNKLYTSFLTVPMMLNFESNPRKSSRSFRVSAGGYAGLMLASRTKQCYKDDDGDLQTQISRNDFNLNKFRYGLAGQVGVGPINFWANYSLVPMFETNKGPSGADLYPLNMGITLIGF